MVNLKSLKWVFLYECEVISPMWTYITPISAVVHYACSFFVHSTVTYSVWIIFIQLFCIFCILWEWIFSSFRICSMLLSETSEIVSSFLKDSMLCIIVNRNSRFSVFFHYLENYLRWTWFQNEILVSS